MGVENFMTIDFWKNSYLEKKNLMDSRFPEVSPVEFYRDLFPKGTIEEKGNYDSGGKGNIIATSISSNPSVKTRSWVVTDDLTDLKNVIGVPFGLIAPISWWGKSHGKINAHELFAFAIDIDYLDWQKLKNLLNHFKCGIQPTPNYLVSSGKGVHLYYLLENPVPLYHNLEKLLSNIKKGFIRGAWFDATSLKPDKPDITGIYQGFRCVGSLSKLGEGFPVRAWKLSDVRFTIESFVASSPRMQGRGKEIDLSILNGKPEWKPKALRVPLEECQTLFPDWYERVIAGKKTKSEVWHNSPRLYEWWKRQLMEHSVVGGRYFALVSLCAFGRKCGIDDETVRRDAYGFLEHMESITDDETNHFTKFDVSDALRSLNNPYIARLTRQWIAEHSKIEVKANKRNGRPQNIHVDLMNKMREIKKGFGECNDGGRPSAEEAFHNYYLYFDEPTCSGFCQCTGYKKSVWYKYKKIYDSNLASDPHYYDPDRYPLFQKWESRRFQKNRKPLFRITPYKI